MIRMSYKTKIIQNPQPTGPRTFISNNDDNYWERPKDVEIIDSARPVLYDSREKPIYRRIGFK